MTRFADRFVVAQRDQRLGHARGRKCVALAHLDRRGVVGETDASERHRRILRPGSRIDKRISQPSLSGRDPLGGDRESRCRPAVWAVERKFGLEGRRREIDAAIEHRREVRREERRSERLRALQIGRPVRA